VSVRDIFAKLASRRRRGAIGSRGVPSCKRMAGRSSPATFTADAVWLRHLYALVFLSIGSRRIEYLACTSKPHTAWVPLKCPAAAEQWLGGSR
jgi:hypothetical protein